MITIALLMGMDDPSKGKDPNSSADINADNFRDIKASLIERGFQNRKTTQAEWAKEFPKAAKEKPYLEEFIKTYENTSTGKVITLRLRVFFGPSGIDEESKAFHYFFRYAINTAGIMMYDGHSGLGGHLDLASIEENESFKFAPPTNKYQIYFFNSCSSYSYYNSMFFDRKVTDADPKGSKNLDILTNGLATLFSVMHNTNFAVIDAVDLWASGNKKVSYQQLASEIDSDNLFGISGDDDNPTK